MPHEPARHPVPVADPEMETEQAYLDHAYSRLDAMRRAARQVAEGWREVRAGGTHQARLERDIATEHTRRRLATLDLGDAPLSFGRIDRAGPDDHGNTGAFYVGRIAVTEEDQTPLVVDWRAPVAEPFYRATAVSPMGVARRRHFRARGQELLALDDEILDADAVADADLTLVGEGALLAALERERTGRMRDIVATIQAEQDEAIRAEPAGVLVVEGGPGTGKTAVALHRAAYLLYTHRRRLAAQGVLFVGPSSLFLHYVETVLPSLGEDEVVLATPASLKPGVTVRAADPPELAALKGDERMAALVAGALADRERPLPRAVELALDGHRLWLARSDSARIVARARRRRGTHNGRRLYVVKAVLSHLRRQYRQALVAAYRRPDSSDPQPSFDLDGGVASSISLDRDDEPVAAALARGDAAPEEWEADLTDRLRSNPAVRAALDRMWPVLSGVELVHDLFSFEALIVSAARRTALSEAEARALARPRARDVREAPWTGADLALVDEADELLGPTTDARPRRRRGPSREDLESARRVASELGVGGFLTPDEIARRYAGDGDEARRDDSADGPRTFGHVLVDEAQDLTPMQWRMLARRCPARSMTLVGDVGQASEPGATRGWHEVGRALGSRGEPRRVLLTVNYRTPAEIMAVANRVLAAGAPSVAPARPVRATGVEPRFVGVAPGRVCEAAAAEARAALGQPGTVAVLAPQTLHDQLVTALADAGARAGGSTALDAPIAVLDATTAKGLEFDDVVLVEPLDLVTPDPAGMRLLYTALTRATQRLTVVHSGRLPEALAVGAPTVTAAPAPPSPSPERTALHD